VRIAVWICKWRNIHAIRLHKRLLIHSRKLFGSTGPEELLEEQRKVYDFVKERGKATTEEILNKFKMKSGELTQIMIVLRRLKLAKGAKIGDKTYLVPWDINHQIMH
jgi:transcription initiation factor IIE alpha subunit